MGRVHGESARIYVDEFNLSGRANSVDLSFDLPTAEVTAFEDGAKEFVQGKNQRSWSLDMRAAADYDDAEIDEIIQNLIADGSVGHAVGVYFDGSAVGSHGYEGVGALNRDTVRAPGGNAQMLDAQFAGSGAFGRAMKLLEAEVITATGAETGQNHMAAATGDIIISVVRITAVTGSGSVTFRLEESTDDGGGDAYGTVLTHDALTAVGHSVATIVMASMPGPWFRYNTFAFSGFTDVTVRAAVAILPMS